MVTLYFRLIGARIRAQMQYKVSFLIDMLGFMLTTALEFAVIAILLTRFQSLGGWSVAEIALLYGLTETAFSITEMAGRGFDAPFEIMMQRGTFDGVLTRPLGAFFQVLASEFQLKRIGRMLQAVAVLAFAFSHARIVWTPAHVLLVPLTILSGAAIYMGILVIGATICFWTVKAPEVINAFFYGGNQMTSYPLGIYSGWLRTTFLFVVPVAFSNYPTALVLLGRSDPNGLPAGIAWTAPAVAALFLGVSLVIWRFGVTRYQSAGS